jgi:hypothetical protein
MMASGVNTKVRGYPSHTPFIYSYDVLVDYILFFTGDVDVTMNPNEIRDYKYVSKDELQAMFDAPGV